MKKRIWGVAFILAAFVSGGLAVAIVLVRNHWEVAFFAAALCYYLLKRGLGFFHHAGQRVVDETGHEGRAQGFWAVKGLSFASAIGLTGAFVLAFGATVLDRGGGWLVVFAGALIELVALVSLLAWGVATFTERRSIRKP